MVMFVVPGFVLGRNVWVYSFHQLSFFNYYSILLLFWNLSIIVGASHYCKNQFLSIESHLFLNEKIQDKTAFLEIILAILAFSKMKKNLWLIFLDKINLRGYHAPVLNTTCQKYENWLVILRDQTQNTINPAISLVVYNVIPLLHWQSEMSPSDSG